MQIPLSSTFGPHFPRKEEETQLHGSALPPTPDRAPNPHFLEKRVSESKNPIPPHPHTTWKREFSAKKSPFSLCSLVEKRGFFDRKLPFPGRGEMGFLGPETLFSRK